MKNWLNDWRTNDMTMAGLFLIKEDPRRGCTILSLEKVRRFRHVRCHKLIIENDLEVLKDIILFKNLFYPLSTFKRRGVRER